MGDLDMKKAGTTDMTNAVNNYYVENKDMDSPSYYNETTYDFENAQAYLSYYKQIPELKKAIDAFAIWTAGKGMEIKSIRDEILLQRVSGMGKENFKQILKNMLRVKKYQGDAFAEIIRDENGELLNLKPLATGDMRIVVDEKGILKRYEQLDQSKNKAKKVFDPPEILHLPNDRTENEIHGTSVIEACQWVIDARNEAMSDYRKVLHRNVVPVRIIEIDSDDPNRRDHMIAQYEQAIQKGEVLVIPKDTVSIDDNQITIQDPTTWIKYLENFFYQAVGIPRVIATSQDYTEAGSKVGYLTFEPIYSDEQTDLEQSIFNQLGIDLTFKRPPSLKEDMQSDEAKNTGQTSFQPKESGINMQRE